MQCAEFEQRLQQLLDDRQKVEQDSLLQEHARGCDACGRVLRGQAGLLAGLRMIPKPTFAADLGHRVLDQLRIDQRKRNNRLLVIAALAAAAVIMVALLPLAGDRVRFQRDHEHGGGIALVSPGPQQTPKNAFTEQDSNDLRMLMHSLMLQFSEHRLEMFEPVDQLASGIRPLALTFNLAFVTLRRALPGYSEPRPAEPQAFYHGLRSSIS
ncbi:MAG TPA: hypothetical protein VMM76_01505 [Pirellulaceae bacterium]|nr:hypothetical protein [Pirellulaceae bacterium]